jgi:hypothetical protein
MQLSAAILTMGMLAGIQGDRDATQLQGVRLEMTKDQVHKVLGQVADYKLQDENQEVWVFRSDPNIRSIIVGFAPDNRVRYITAIAKPDGRPLSCRPLGNIKNAQVAGTAGNLVFTHSWKEHHEEFVATARGTTKRLASCSVKKAGAGIENEEEEERQRHRVAK